MNERRFHVAMVVYTVLAVLALWTLDEWRIRAAVLILLAGLAVKSWIAMAKGRQEN